jgi:predicted MFS family arabinose efflux permease
MALFVVAVAMCGWAPSLAVLVAGRAVAGASWAAVGPAGFS